MTPIPRTIDWQAIYDWQAVYESSETDMAACYTYCGGYCCKNFHANDFRILAAKEVVLPIIESEYDHLMSIGGMKRTTDHVQHETFTLADGYSVKLYFLKCACEGFCSPHANRPLICRLYPYLPKIDYEGNIIGFDYAALVDLFYASKDKHPCYLVRHEETVVQSQMKAALQPLVANPEMIFLLKAASLVVKSLRNCLNDTFDPQDEAARKAFLKKYEYQVFTRSAWRTEAFKAGMAEIFRAAYGL